MYAVLEVVVELERTRRYGHDCGENRPHMETIAGILRGCWGLEVMQSGLN